MSFVSTSQSRLRHAWCQKMKIHVTGYESSYFRSWQHQRGNFVLLYLMFPLKDNIHDRRFSPLLLSFHDAENKTEPDITSSPTSLP